MVMKKFTVKPRFTGSRRILIGNHENSQEYVFVGRLAEAGQLVRVEFDLSTPHVVAIFGKRGSGKSYTLGSFVEGLCTKGNQTSISATSRTHATLLFDTLGIFQWLDVLLTPDSAQKLVREQATSQRGWDI